jgi:hypothetical protein
MSEEEEDVVVAEVVEEISGDVFVCSLCTIKKSEPLKDKKYCENCSNNLHQAYQWMQSPMLTAAESKSLNDKLMNLTDLDAIIFED